MGPKTTQLVEALGEIVILLRSEGEKHWCHYIDDCRNHLLSSDYYGIDKLLSSYGGMGSFNDVVVGYSAATENWKPEAEKQNDKLNVLRSKAYDLAQEIRRANGVGGN